MLRRPRSRSSDIFFETQFSSSDEGWANW